MSRQQTHKLAVAVLTGVAAVVVIPIILVILYVVWQGLPMLSWAFLTEPPRNGMTEGGIMPALLGTVILTFGTAIVSFPLSIATAIYLAEYAGDNRLTRWIRMAIVNLAGIPSIVYGLFGLGMFVLFLGFGTSILAGSLTLGIMTMPVVIVAMVRIRVLVKTLFAVEHQEIQAERVEGRHEDTSQHREVGKTGSRQVAEMHRLDDRVLGIEAREQREADQRERTQQ